MVWLELALALAGSMAAANGDPSEAGRSEARESEVRKFGVVDAHMHISPTEIDRLHSIMDEVGIAWGVNLSGMWPGGPLERQIDAAKRSGRLVVACNLPWFLAQRREDFPAIAVQLLRESKRLGARALKIEKALGLQVLRTNGALLSVDDPWLDPIWSEAGKQGLPVVIHTADPKAFWLPVDEKNERHEELSAHPSWSNHGLPGLPSFEDLLAQLMRVVKRHPGTTFVAVHFGNNAEDPAWVARMLDEHANLYVDIAARIVELGRHDPLKLRRIFIEHHRRILFGTDLGVSPGNFLMLGSFGSEPNLREEIGPFFAAHYRFLETAVRSMPSPTPIQGRWTLDGIDLPEYVLTAIYRENAIRLFGPPPKGSAAVTLWFRAPPLK